MMVGVLYIVATPIGNLEDITLRALRVLKEADLIAAEDTRHTQKLLSHYDIHTPLTSYHEHNERTKAPALVERLVRGERIALVSDAGTPAISDPGYRLVVAAVAAGVQVTPIPGPSALTAALSAAAQRGMRVEKVALAGARDKNAFLNAVAKALVFPDYFGHNWDAFYDCLVDLEHDKGEGLLVLLRDASGFARAEPDEFAAAVDALQDAVDFWEDEQKTLLVVVELEAPVLAPELPEVSGR